MLLECGGVGMIESLLQSRAHPPGSERDVSYCSAVIRMVISLICFNERPIEVEPSLWASLIADLFSDGILHQQLLQLYLDVTSCTHISASAHTNVGGFVIRYPDAIIAAVEYIAKVNVATDDDALYVAISLDMITGLIRKSLTNLYACCEAGLLQSGSDVNAPASTHTCSSDDYLQWASQGYASDDNGPVVVFDRGSGGYIDKTI